MPDQYPSMKRQQTIANLVNTLGTMDLQDEDDTDDEFMVSQVHMVKSRLQLDPPSCQPIVSFKQPTSTGYDPPSDILEVRAHFEYGHTLKDGEVYAISDGGADSCILGMNAKVLSYTGRYATLIGYDPATTKTEKVPIVTALIKCTSSSEGGYPILLKVHEAPYNAGSPITLLSEYQIREYGLIIDSVATKHRTGINTTGTQRFQVNPHVHINFEDRGGLMGFRILPIETQDQDLYDVITITSPEKWRPHRFAQTSPQPYYYDSTDQDTQEDTSYPAMVNHLQTPLENVLDIGEDTMMSDSITTMCTHQPLVETQVLATATWHKVIYQGIDPRILRPYLGWRPLNVVKKTLEKTTQMAKMIIRHPMRRHVKSRFPHMNVTRIDESVSTDPIFSNCKSIYHGYTAAQIFYGIKSHTIYVYGIKSKGEFPNVYRDFIREHGAPSALRRDNAKEEQSEEVKDINREYMIKDQLSEPYNPQQNPVESNAIRYLKGQIHMLLDRTGAPDSLWFMAAQYAADVHNICSDAKHPSGITPLQYQQGATPDISAYLQFTFWEPILYLDHEAIWPSSKERSGRWLGIAHNIGDALTFWILDDQSKYILARSVIRPFNQNLRVKWDPSLVESNKHSAKHGEDIMPKDYQVEPTNDQLTRDTQYIPLMDNGIVRPEYINQGLDTSTIAVPATGPTTRSKGKLSLSNDTLPTDDSIETFTKSGKEPYKKVKYKKKYTPPESQGVPTRRSDQLKGRPTTLWTSSRNNEARLSSTTGLLIVPSSSQAEPTVGLKDTPTTKESLPLSLTDQDERLRAYHGRIDLMHAIIHPEQDDYDWQVEDILEWKANKEGTKIFLKIRWFGGGQAMDFYGGCKKP